MAHRAETNAANAEAPHVAARTPAQIAAVANARAELRFLMQSLGLGDLTGLGHV